MFSVSYHRKRWMSMLYKMLFKPCQCKPCACDLDDCNRSDSVCRLLSSIACIEAALSHILNAEGEKIQKAVEIAGNVCELLEVNESVRKTVTDVTMLEQVLFAKLNAVLEIDQCINNCEDCKTSERNCPLVLFFYIFYLLCSYNDNFRDFFMSETFLIKTINYKTTCKAKMEYILHRTMIIALFFWLSSNRFPIITMWCHVLLC